MSLVILFVKAPVYGHVKTRLAATVGNTMALSLYRLFVETTLSRLSFFSPLHIAYTPAPREALIKPWLRGVHTCSPQKGDDLGARMHHALRQAFANGHRTAIIIGGDIPDLPVERVRDAFHALKSHDAVFVPTSDGGYCLVGARKGALLAPLLEKMTWSHPKVMEKTLERARVHKIRVKCLSPWHDIDTVKDLKAFLKRHGSRPDLPALYGEATHRINGGGDFFPGDAHGCGDGGQGSHP